MNYNGLLFQQLLIITEYLGKNIGLKSIIMGYNGFFFQKQSIIITS